MIDHCKLHDTPVLSQVSVHIDEKGRKCVRLFDLVLHFDLICSGAASAETLSTSIACDASHLRSILPTLSSAV